ncbi:MULTISPECIES: hypothetical protein [unclassified Microcoleus]|uniref:hypothetical protein n=1 Tax=unclassified Microcoleus TaxID=2642155 RepID=UPI002FD2726C
MSSESCSDRVCRGDRLAFCKCDGFKYADAKKYRVWQRLRLSRSAATEPTSPLNQSKNLLATCSDLRSSNNASARSRTQDAQQDVK